VYSYKDQTGVAPLSVDGTYIYNAKDEAETLNSQFLSVFSYGNT